MCRCPWIPFLSEDVVLLLASGAGRADGHTSNPLLTRVELGLGKNRRVEGGNPTLSNPGLKSKDMHLGLRGWFNADEANLSHAHGGCSGTMSAVHLEWGPVTPADRMKFGNFGRSVPLCRHTGTTT